MRKLWERYSRKKRWWSVVLDFVFFILLIGMLIPWTRKPLAAFFIRQTLFSPSESDKVVYLDEADWDLRFEEVGRLKELSLKDFKYRPVFLNFWATWCPPCIAEMPSIQELYDEYKEDVVFILISNESADVINAFMKKNKYSLPVYSITSRVPAIFETKTIPSTYLIGRSERLRIHKTGAAKWNSDKMKEILDKMIRSD
jgi:thiol-disulfide isomerase/thioredoxin